MSERYDVSATSSIPSATQEDHRPARAAHRELNQLPTPNFQLPTSKKIAVIESWRLWAIPFEVQAAGTGELIVRIPVVFA
jgi:hypothetical protein